ncbi:hypothetical protein MPSEU_000403900 [Mayamaea pseudoterrestris]|nr:hypothetical protein MPSEU_000403900 [Mayamaea pseudoterrestris]
MTVIRISGASSRLLSYHVCILTLFIILTISVSSFTSPLRQSTIYARHNMAAKNAEEDLELTRQIILGHIVTSDSPESKDDTNPSSDRPVNDLMIRAAMGETVERTPVWLFRQAGRHLPEYQDYKKQLGKNFLELLADPMAVAECTLQPVRRYPLDAAILFSDILVLVEALGIPVTMPGGVGIQVPEPLQSPSEIETRLVEKSQITPAWVRDNLGHVLAAVRQIRSHMKAEAISVPLIGFSAAPYTLLYYMIGGSSKKNNDIGTKWLTEHPEESKKLLDKLTLLVVEYLSAQVEAGCHMLQIFEAMGMMIDDANFEKFALPCLESIGTQLKERHPNIPLMVFCRGACQMNDKVAALGCYNVITMDGSVDRTTARSVVGSNVSLQGSYDPAELIAENGKTAETVRNTAKQYLEDLGPQRLIANLGEGLGGKESTDLVDVFVRAIHEESEAMIKAGMQ